MMNGSSGQADFNFSSDGLLAFAPSGALTPFANLTLSWMDLRGTISSLFDTLRGYNSVSLSPDGQMIATDISAANDDIWVYQIARGMLTRLTLGGGNNNYPTWSPDGKYVIYNSEKGRSPNIFRKPWNGSGAEERLTSSSNAQIPVSFTPDGRMLSFNENGDIWILPIDSGDGITERKPWPFIQSPAQEVGGFISPDGRWMGYTSDESGKNEVCVAAFPKHEGKWQISNGGGIWPIWSRDGKELFYINGQSLMVVDVHAATTFDFSVPRKVCEIPTNVTVWDISPDGQRFLSVVAKTQQLTLPRLEIVTDWFEAVKAKCAGNKN
jgi:Tol biopolymer transport system component